MTRHRPIALPRPASLALCAGLLGTPLFHSAAFAGADACRDDPDCGGYYRCIQGVCTVPPAVTGRADEKTPTLEVLSDGSSGGRFFLELATDPFSQARGLGGRPSLAPGWGMLFVFPGLVEHAFTMLPMSFALDLVFIGADGAVLDIVANAKPGVAVVRAAHPYRYVLEINAGVAGAHGMKVGDRIDLTGVAPASLPAGRRP